MINLLNLQQATEKFKEVTRLPYPGLKPIEDFSVPTDLETVYSSVATKEISFNRIVAAANFDSLSGGLLESLLAICAYPSGILKTVKVTPMIGGIVITYLFEVYEEENV